jgi:hypothetical protein
MAANREIRAISPQRSKLYRHYNSSTGNFEISEGFSNTPHFNRQTPRIKANSSWLQWPRAGGYSTSYSSRRERDDVIYERDRLPARHLRAVGTVSHKRLSK